MESEIAISAQLGILDTQEPTEKPRLPITSGDQTLYTVHQQSILPDTGELQEVGSTLFIGLLCLIVILIFRRYQNSKSNT